MVLRDMIERDMKMRVGFLSNTRFHVTPYHVTVHHVTRSRAESDADI